MKRFYERTPPSLRDTSPFRGGMSSQTICRDTACRVRRFMSRYIPLKTFHRNVSKIKELQTAHKGGAVLFAPPSKSYRFSHPPSPCAKSMAQGVSPSADGDSEGYSPSKNTSPTVLSWISLMGQQLQNRSVSARWFLIFAVKMFPYRVSIPRINPAFCATINACPKQTRILN